MGCGSNVSKITNIHQSTSTVPPRSDNPTFNNTNLPQKDYPIPSNDDPIPNNDAVPVDNTIQQSSIVYKPSPQPVLNYVLFQLTKSL